MSLIFRCRLFFRKVLLVYLQKSLDGNDMNSFTSPAFDLYRLWRNLAEQVPAFTSLLNQLSTLLGLLVFHIYSIG